MDRHSREREFLERELAAAIGTSALRPWYQPIVHLRNARGHRLRSARALESSHPWNIPPDRFIPIAEDCGLIRELSDHLLRRACEDARSWPDGVMLSFNISPVQLKDKTLGLRILSILGEVRPDAATAGNRDHRERPCARPRCGKAGAWLFAGGRCTYCVGRLWNGYSSLYHLRNFKFDTIKIDRSFIESMNSESESAAIVRALTGLGHGLGLTITAEGIELSDQWNALLKQGCEQGQGVFVQSGSPRVMRRLDCCLILVCFRGAALPA